MFKLIINKIVNKKWLNISLLVGIILLSAVLFCHPIFNKGALDKLIQTKFTQYAKENCEYPAVIKRDAAYSIDGFQNIDTTLTIMKKYEEKWLEYVDTDKVSSQFIVSIKGCNANTSLGGKGKYVEVGYIEDLEKHSTVVKGISLNEAYENEELMKECQGNDYYPCVMTQEMMDAKGLVVDEVVNMIYILDENEISLKLKIVGICRECEDADNFWYRDMADFESILLVGKDDMNEIIERYQPAKVLALQNTLFDYRQIKKENALLYLDYLRQFMENDSLIKCNFYDILNSYNDNRISINVIMWVLELPVIILILLFVYMVSSQIISMEETEIAMLKSRGVERKQILLMYLFQALLMSFVGAIIGIPVGILFCKAAGSTDAFLEFANKDVSMYVPTIDMIYYGLIAVGVTVIFMTLPVISRSKTSIVEEKSKKHKRKDMPAWEKYFIDIILLALSSYLLYNYMNQQDDIYMNILRKGTLDPVIFIDSSLFIFSFGLVLIRLSKYLVKLIYMIGKKKFSTALYASFTQITRSGKEYNFILIFLVMTIALGIYNANMARTINENNEKRIEYNLGTDLCFQEKWELKIAKPDQYTIEWEYAEPDFSGYTSLIGNGVESVTRVIIDDNTIVKVKNKKLDGCILMGINTKEFGETAFLMDGINNSHWYNALNSIATVNNGVIISNNLANEYGLSVGDRISYDREAPVSALAGTYLGETNATIMAIVEAWPGYERYYYEYDAEGILVEREKYLIVANYANVVSKYTITPYSVWVKLSNTDDYSTLSSYFKENNKEILTLDVKSEDIQAMKDSAMIQTTNGLFTISFLISIVICSVGFLIYWIMSIKKRELLFGIYRAMGMSMGEIILMLVNEQIFSSFLSCLAGIGAGALTTMLFTKIVALVYLPEKHCIPIEVFISNQDMMKIVIQLLVIFLICFIVLRTIVKNMKIAQALKLGED